MVLRKELNLLWEVISDKLNIAVILLIVICLDVFGNLLYDCVRLSDEANYYGTNQVVFEYVEPDPVIYEENVIDMTIEEIVEEEEIVYDFELTGYIDVNTELNIRTEPSRQSEIIGTLTWMNEVHYSVVNDDWAIIQLEDGTEGFIASKYITDTLETYTKSFDVSGDHCKTYMDFRTITDKSSKQYALQLRATTNEGNGLRMLRNRFMIAVGSYFGCKVGQYVDVVLSDGEVLECIIGDAKQDIHTDANNIHGLSGDTAEFIVDTITLNQKTDVVGNISDVSDVFDGRVVEVRVYDHIER